MQDRSAGGMRLVLARNVGLPKRFGVHDDLSGEIVTVSAGLAARPDSRGAHSTRWAALADDAGAKAGAFRTLLRDARLKLFGERRGHRGEHAVPIAGGFCRNSRAVGYHGESSRSRIHRHSASYLSAIHTGRANAPARCATEVSQETTRSRCAIAAAVSTNASPPASNRLAERLDGESARRAICSEPTPSCNEMSRTRKRRRAAPAPSARTSARDRRPGSGLPCQTTPILKPSAPIFCPQRRERLRFCAEIGNVRRDGFEAGAESARQAAQRDLRVERLVARRRLDELRLARPSAAGDAALAERQTSPDAPAALINGR